MQIRLKLTSMGYTRDIRCNEIASPPKLRIFILKCPRRFFGICAGDRCHLRQLVVRRRLLSHCDNDPRFAKEVEEKREGQGIVNKQVRFLPNQLSTRRSPTLVRPSSPRVRHTLPLSANEHSY